MPFEPSPDVAEKLDEYLTLLLLQNESLNLTAARTLEELQERHLKDCLELLTLPEVQNAKKALDVGTGGGLPGIPLAIARPELNITLLDATQKKIRAVQQFIDELELSNATAVAGRAEELGHDAAWRQSYDLVVSRALAPLPSLLEYLSAFVKPGGHIVAFKGTDVRGELYDAREAMKLLKLEFVRREEYEMRALPFSLVVFRQLPGLPSTYPRGQGLVRKQPLGMPKVSPPPKSAASTAGVSAKNGTPGSPSVPKTRETAGVKGTSSKKVR